MNIPDWLNKRITWKKMPKSEQLVMPNIEKLELLPTPCEDCDRKVRDRRVHFRRCITHGGHWRVRCQTCGNYKNPQTKQFDITSLKEVINFYFYYNKRDK